MSEELAWASAARAGDHEAHHEDRPPPQRRQARPAAEAETPSLRLAETPSLRLFHDIIHGLHRDVADQATAEPPDVRIQMGSNDALEYERSETAI
eukprot:10535148-Karenia_brevis.AAC.1